MEKTWHGFLMKEFLFEGYEAVLVLPKQPLLGGCIVLKTEYWDAIPDVERRLGEAGLYLAYIKNRTRFATKDDCDRKARFVYYLSKTYGLNPKCILIGMSCGGAHAVRFAGFYPELVQCVYLDAPVLNYSSFPGKVGVLGCEQVWQGEFLVAYPGVSRWQLLSFQEHPLCMAEILIKHRIPILLVWGTDDRLVPYEENGWLLEEACTGFDQLTVICVQNRGHHPHGMAREQDNQQIVDYLLCHSAASNAV